MGSIPYEKVFKVGADSLVAEAKRKREIFKEHFLGLKQSHQRNIAIQLRSLAVYMRFRVERWPLAFDKLFAMRYGDAQHTVNSHRNWQKAKPDCSKKLSSHCMFLGLSRALRSKGMINWEFRHIRAQRSHARWNACPAGFRLHGEEFMREGRARGLAKGTMWSIKNDLTVFGLFLARKRLSHLDLPYTDAVSWFEEVCNSGLAPKTVNRQVMIVKRFYNWLIARGLIRISPLSTLRTVREPHKLPRILTERQVRKLILATTEPRERAIIEIMYSSGARLGDLRNMDLPKVSLEDRVAKTTVKGKNEAMLYLNNASIRALKRYMPLREAILKERGVTQESALFVSKWGRRYSACGIRGAVHNAARKGLPNLRVYPHMIRHSFAAHMLNRGADVYSIMRLLGHRDIQSTVTYLQVATARLSLVHSKYHPRK